MNVQSLAFLAFLCITVCVCRRLRQPWRTWALLAAGLVFYLWEFTTAARWGCALLAVSACVYGAMWLTALGGDAQVSFGQNGLWLTAAVWGGGTLAGIMGQGKRRRKTVPRGKRRVVDKRRKRAVT